MLAPQDRLLSRKGLAPAPDRQSTMERDDEGPFPGHSGLNSIPADSCLGASPTNPAAEDLSTCSAGPKHPVPPRRRCRFRESGQQRQFFEIQSSQLAREKSQNSRVREFAQWFRMKTPKR
jgi:predicted outer membrane protein